MRAFLLQLRRWCIPFVALEGKDSRLGFSVFVGSKLGRRALDKPLIPRCADLNFDPC